jgi:hypothetical protein
VHDAAFTAGRHHAVLSSTVAALFVGLIPGTPGENEYGVDPRTDGPDTHEQLADILS